MRNAPTLMTTALALGLLVACGTEGDSGPDGQLIVPTDDALPIGDGPGAEPAPDDNDDQGPVEEPEPEPTMEAPIDPEPIIDCFPEGGNANKDGVDVLEGAVAEGGLTCDREALLALDGEVAALAYEGGTAAVIGEHAVTACAVIDLGAQCATGEHIGMGVSAGPGGPGACGDTASSGQCDVEDMCGASTGASVLLFAGSSPDDLQFAARVGGCGEGKFLHTLTPLTSLAGTADLESVRYLAVCRPWEGCAADEGNIEVDALYLTRRD